MYLYVKRKQGRQTFEAMEAPFGHIEGIASGPIHTSEQLRLPFKFHSSKRYQGTIHKMGLQDMVELCRKNSITGSKY